MKEEKKIVTWSLISLFLSLTIVYSLVYLRKTEVFTSLEPIQEEVLPSVDTVKEKIEVIEEKSDTSGAFIVNMGTENTEWTMGTTTWTTWTVWNLPTAWTAESPSWVNILNTQSPWTNRENSHEAVLASTEPLRLLSWTTQFFGMLDIVDILGISPEYTLQDSKGNFFAYYGTKGLDFVRTVQQLWGNVYTMVTENEILKNELFGDKVSFINLLVFKDKFVLIVLELGGKTWLLQIPADKYHHEKSYLKSLFI